MSPKRNPDFTPRVLINIMVELMQPALDDVIVDPTAGTGGFLISAHHSAPNEKAREKFVKQFTKDNENEPCRLRCFSCQEIAEKDDSLDLSWIRDDSDEDPSNLPEPDVLINEAIEEMAGAMNELKAILVELGSSEESEETQV